MSTPSHDPSHDIYQKLSTLGITLPPLSIPAAAYVPFVQTGNLVFLSGHIAKKDSKAWVGQLGKNIDTAEGKLAARAIAIDLMGTLHAALAAKGKTLNDVTRIVKLMSLVNSTGDYTEQHLVTNGASELFGEVFGSTVGAHARSAFGVAQIPMGACVEIEMIAEVG
jgi:enamine deaminase RidA (YjgF/YER057c/UK114 family)